MKSSVLTVAASLFLNLAIIGLAHAETYIVDRYQDDTAKGSLRWAIEQSNTHSSSENQIHIQAVGKAPYLIQLKQPLPAIRSAVKIIGTPWAQTGDFIVLDGSLYIKGEGAKACPGADPTQYGTNVRTTTLPGLVLQDVNNVTLKGLDIHHFCIGVLINRSSHNLLQHNRISNNYGGSGVMLTGDDGQGNPTATTTINNKILDNVFIDNGDGLELTRGAAFNLVANNLFTSTQANPEPSQGIEILWGNDNVVVGNKFENYSDGVQINWGKRNYIAYNELAHNSIGLNITGDGNILDSNRVYANRLGVAIRSEQDVNARTTLTKNLIWDNGKNIQRCEAGGSCVADQRLGAIIFAVPALEHADFIGSRGGGVMIETARLQKTCTQPVQQNCNPLPNQNIQAPHLSYGSGYVTAKIQAQPNQRYRIEFFANDQVDAQEAQHYLGMKMVTTDRNGQGIAVWQVKHAIGNMTANVTNHLGATSELSRAVRIP